MLPRRSVTSRALLTLLALAVFVALLPALSIAQDNTNYPKVDIFGGYS